MAARTVKVRLEGHLHDGLQVEIEESDERWTRVKLEDGSVLRMKTVVTHVARIPNRYDADGAPVYVIRSSNILVVDAAEHLLRDAQGSPSQVQ